MIRVLALLFFVNISFANEPCHIEVAPYILKINKVLSQEIIHSTNCKTQTNEKIVKFLSSAEGTIHAQRINALLNTSEAVELKPAKIKVVSLYKKLNNHFSKENILIKNVSSLYPKSFYAAKTEPSLNFQCPNCKTPGTHSIQLKLNATNIWINISTYKQVFAYKTKNGIGYMTPVLTEKDFKRSSFFTQERTNYFTDIKNVRFYKPTRNLAPGEIIRVNDLLPKNLINRGQKVKIIVKNKSVKLNSVGKALRSGKIGEFIEIENPKSKKTTLARVIDYNKVLVEL